MNNTTTLLERFWVTKEFDKDIYYKLRYDMKPVEMFAREYVGWRTVSNERLIKYEKIPAKAEPFMGIEEFQDNLDYIIFCSLLIYLEDLEDNEAFLLPEMIDMIGITLKGKFDLDWTLFIHRKSLVRVMQYAEKLHLVIERDGNLDDVSRDIQSEVLYENTGLSRYYAVNYPFDVTQYKDYRDFEKNDELADADRGHLRINRVYRMLATSPAMYWDSADDQTSIYLKNQRAWVSKYLDEYIGGRLDIHKNAAFFVQTEEEYGEVFPTGATLSDITLLMCAAIRDVKGLEHKANDTTIISIDYWIKLLTECKAEYQEAWSKEYREMSVDKISDNVLRYMEEWMLLKREEDSVRIMPALYKFAGRYPKSFNMDNADDSKKSSKVGTIEGQMSFFS